jgi:hypothetical protein
VPTPHPHRHVGVRGGQPRKPRLYLLQTRHGRGRVDVNTDPGIPQRRQLRPQPGNLQLSRRRVRRDVDIRKGRLSRLHRRAQPRAQVAVRLHTDPCRVTADLVDLLPQQPQLSDRRRGVRAHSHIGVGGADPLQTLLDVRGLRASRLRVDVDADRLAGQGLQPGTQPGQVGIDTRVAETDIQLGHAAERGLQPGPQRPGERPTSLLPAPSRRRTSRPSTPLNAVPNSRGDVRGDLTADDPTDLVTDPRRRRHQSRPEAPLDPLRVGQNIDLDGANGNGRHQEPPPGALRGAPLQQLQQSIR